MFVPSQIHREEDSTYSLCYNFGGSHGKEKPVDVCHSYRLVEGKRQRQCIGTIEEDLYRPQGFSHSKSRRGWLCQDILADSSLRLICSPTKRLHP